MILLRKKKYQDDSIYCETRSHGYTCKNGKSLHSIEHVSCYLLYDYFLRPKRNDSETATEAEPVRSTNMLKFKMTTRFRFPLPHRHHCVSALTLAGKNGVRSRFQRLIAQIAPKRHRIKWHQRLLHCSKFYKPNI